MSFDPAGWCALLLWGTLVGLDLVSVPQALLARPLVAGTVAGVLLGDLEAGVRIGVLLELFALDVLPVGASWYPDYGPATVGATAYAAAVSGWEASLGIACAIGLAVGLAGGASLQWLRHRVARDLNAHSEALAAGRSDAIRALHYRSLARDALRSAALTLLALGLALAAARWLSLDARTENTLTLVAIGCGLAAVIGGALRSAGRGARMRWFVAGAAGTALLLGIA
jgi:mannose/fructose/N-acetylgalactosamine-specific phosphotransferase system component IIC